MKSTDSCSTRWLATVDSEFLRFLIAGGVNTGLTQLLYMFLLLVLPYLSAYSVSYIAGIYLSYYLNSRYVFKQKMQPSKAIQYPIIYLVQYVVGLGLLYGLVEWLNVHKVIAPLCVVVLTLPLVFLLSRLIIMRPSDHAECDFDS